MKTWAIEFSYTEEDCTFIEADTKQEAIKKLREEYPDAQIDGIELEDEG